MTGFVFLTLRWQATRCHFLAFAPGSCNERTNAVQCCISGWSEKYPSKETGGNFKSLMMTLQRCLCTNDYDDDSFGGEGALLKDGWVKGVGEGRSDEDNLSFYLRMLEGAGESSDCRFAHFPLSIHFSPS
jgi:hypothetical protein